MATLVQLCYKDSTTSKTSWERRKRRNRHQFWRRDTARNMHQRIPSGMPAIKVHCSVIFGMFSINRILGIICKCFLEHINRAYQLLDSNNPPLRCGSSEILCTSPSTTHKSQIISLVKIMWEMRFTINRSILSTTSIRHSSRRVTFRFISTKRQAVSTRKSDRRRQARRI